MLQEKNPNLFLFFSGQSIGSTKTKKKTQCRRNPSRLKALRPRNMNITPSEKQRLLSWLLIQPEYKITHSGALNTTTLSPFSSFKVYSFVYCVSQAY